MLLDILNAYKNKIKQGEISESLESESDRISAIDWLNRFGSEIVEVDNIKFNIILKGKDSFLLYRFKDYDGSICKGGKQIENGILTTAYELLSSIIKYESMFSRLNSVLEDIKTKNGILLALKFKWGYSKSTSVAYWDYTNIIIKLSEESINEVIDHYSEDTNLVDQYISDITSGFSWSSNIIDFLKEYNHIEFCKSIKSFINIDLGIDKVLTENMLVQSDIKEIVSRNTDKTTTQSFKSVYILQELGLFAAILLWDIDYENKKASVEILEDKVLDIENSRFVSDHSLYSRIEQKILNSSEYIF